MSELYRKYVSNTKTGENGDIIIPASSIGSNKVLSNLAIASTQPNPAVYDIYLINLYTVIRNNMSDDVPVDSVSSDISTITAYITEYIQSVPHSKNTVIIFYLPTYVVPAVYKRELNTSNLKIVEIAKEISKSQAKDNVESSVNNTKVYFTRLSPSLSVSQQLTNTIGRLTKFGRAAKVLLWSHVAIDLHLAKRYSNLSIIESYTGKTVGPREFGYKVFKSKFIPFNNYTHIAFGDSNHIKPVLQRDKRSKAFATAEARRWDLKTDIEILQELVSLSIPSQHLTILKF